MGFGKLEKLTAADLIEEKYRGIDRRQVIPRHQTHGKRNFVDLLDVEKHTGIKLTESFAMCRAVR